MPSRVSLAGRPEQHPLDLGDHMAYANADARQSQYRRHRASTGRLHLTVKMAAIESGMGSQYAVTIEAGAGKTKTTVMTRACWQGCFALAVLSQPCVLFAKKRRSRTLTVQSHRTLHYATGRSERTTGELPCATTPTTKLTSSCCCLPLACTNLACLVIRRQEYACDGHERLLRPLSQGMFLCLFIWIGH